MRAVFFLLWCVASVSALQCSQFINNKSDYEVTYSHLYVLRFNVCRQLVTTEPDCPSASLCLRGGPGTSNRSLATEVSYFVGTQLLFNGTNGVVATIDFVCGAATSNPSLVTTVPLVLKWSSPHACIPCVLSTPTGLVNLTSAGFDHVLTNPSFADSALAFYFNPCMPLSSSLTAPCGPGTYACLTVNGAAAYNLGVAQSLSIIDGILTAYLSNGSACGTLGTFHSFSIRFICTIGNTVQPAYAYVSMCQHVINYYTPLVCGFQ
jgi:hypothetical protein